VERINARHTALVELRLSLHGPGFSFISASYAYSYLVAIPDLTRLTVAAFFVNCDADDRHPDRDVEKMLNPLGDIVAMSAIEKHRQEFAIMWDQLGCLKKVGQLHLEKDAVCTHCMGHYVHSVTSLSLLEDFRLSTVHSNPFVCAMEESYCMVTLHVAAHVVSALWSLTSLESLSIKNIYLLPSCGLEAVLKSNTGLQSLEVVCSRLGTDHADEIGLAMGSFKLRRSLHLSGMELTWLMILLRGLC
jgi:hypothetical protein